MDATASPPRESPLGVLGVAVGLLVLVGAVVALLGRRGGPVDGQALLAEWLEEETLPFELKLCGATELPGGETVVDLEREASSVEETSAADVPPDRVTFVRYRSAASLARLFEGPKERIEASEIDRKRKEWEKDPKNTFHATMDGGEIEWSVWRSRYVVERAFQEDGSWRESVRVNLGRPERHLALLAAWPPDTPHSLEALERILGCVSF